MIGRGDLGTGVLSALLVFGSVSRSVGLSCVRLSLRILFHFILLLPNYNVCSRWFPTHRRSRKNSALFHLDIISKEKRTARAILE